MVPSTDIYKDNGELSEVDKSEYQSVVGSLNYLAQATRYDIQYAVSKLSQHMSNPTRGAHKAAYRVLAYLAATADFTIEQSYVPTVDSVQYYTDSDCGGDLPYSTRSQTGILIMLNHVPVFWKSRKQPVTALCSGTSEIYAMSEGLKSALHYKNQVTDIGIELPVVVPLQADSKTAISFQRGTCLNSRLRGHFSLREGWVIELRDSGKCRVIYTPSQDQLADIFTKPLVPRVFKLMLNKIRHGGRVATLGG